MSAVTGRDAQRTIDDGTGQLRVSLHPLELDPDLAERRVDFALGYFHDFGYAEGAFGEIELAPYASYGEYHDSSFRLWAGAQPRLLVARLNDGQPREMAGWGMGGRLSAEWSWYSAVVGKEGVAHTTCHSGNASWPCDRTHGGGVLRGQLAIGPYAEVAYDAIGPLAVSTIALGVSVRTPALATW